MKIQDLFNKNKFLAGSFFALAIMSPSVSSATVYYPDNLDQPTEIITDGTNLYWADYGDGTIKKIAITGCNMQLGCNGTTYASGTKPYGIAINANGDIFWSQSEAPGSGGGIYSLVSGTATKLIGAANDAPGLIRADDTNVYWVEGGTSGGVYQVNITGTPTRTPLVDSSNSTSTYMYENASGLAIDANNVYWTSYSSSTAGFVGQVSIGGCGAIVSLATSLVYPGRVAVDSTYVYWTSEGTGTNGKLQYTQIYNGMTHGIDTIATGLTYPYGLAIDKTAQLAIVVSYNSGSATVIQYPTTGSSYSTYTLSSSNVYPFGVTVNTTTGEVFWINHDDSSTAGAVLASLEELS